MDEGGDDAAIGAGIDSLDDLAFALRRLRRRHGRQHGDTALTYRELAARSGYAHGVIGDYLTGRILPPTDRLDVLANLLGATGEEQQALATARDQIEERRRPRVSRSGSPERRSRPRSDARPAREDPGEAAAAGRIPEEGIPSDGIQLGGPAAATRTLPRDVASFIGREAELRRVEDATFPGGIVGIHAIGGMAGIGKTAFAVHAAYRLAPRFPDGQIFLPLHGHTPGHRPVEPADALASLLVTAGLSAACIPPGLEPRIAMWRDHLAGKRLLLLLDDAAGHEQVRPLLPGTPESLVLITSRRRLTALEDARAVSLGALPPGDAAELLGRLADRPGLDPADPAVSQITELCCCLPLAIGMMARQLHHHPAWTPGSLAADLVAARDRRLELMRAEDVSVAAAFELSYQDLGAAQRRLFRYLSLHPGTDIDAYAAAALDGSDLFTARRHLEALYDQHLLTEPVHGRYRFHDLIREHARALAAADPAADRDAATDRLLDYYLHTAGAAAIHVAPRQPAVTVAPPVAAPDLPDRDTAVAWLNAERLNLHSAADHAAACGRPARAISISAAVHGYLCSQGHWYQALALHRTALDAVHETRDRAAEARALTGLGIVQRLTGDAASALASFTSAVAVSRDLGDRAGEAAALNELGVTQQATGDPAAGTAIGQALEIYRELGDLFGEAAALNDLGILQTEAGDLQAAASGLTRALELHRSLKDRVWEANALNNIGVVQRLSGDYPAAAASHAQALGIFRNVGSRSGEATVLNSTGELELITGASAKAAAHHEQALAIAVTAGVPAEEARALEGIAYCHLGNGKPAESARYLRQALTVYERIGSPDARRVAAALRGENVRPGNSP